MHSYADRQVYLIYVWERTHTCELQSRSKNIYMIHNLRQSEVTYIHITILLYFCHRLKDLTYKVHTTTVFTLIDEAKGLQMAALKSWVTFISQINLKGLFLVFGIIIFIKIKVISWYTKVNKILSLISGNIPI